jgi:aspartyl-tRNA(Asn)/glutamyl-tRNA(Gln) amidotransferase subunit C
MSIDEQTVRKIGRLARIEVSDSDVTYYGPQMNGILKWIEQLQEVPTDKVEPLASVAEIALYLRPDQVTEGDKADEILANAPEATEGFFVVPKIVE